MCELLSDIYLMTSIILCLLRFGFWASRCSLCWFPHVPVFSMHCACVFCFCGWCDLQPSRLFMVLFMGFVVFCLLILPITERGILHSPTIIVCLFVLSFLLVFALCILKFLLRWLVKISLLNVLFFLSMMIHLVLRYTLSDTTDTTEAIPASFHLHLQCVVFFF